MKKRILFLLFLLPVYLGTAQSYSHFAGTLEDFNRSRQLSLKNVEALELHNIDNPKIIRESGRKAVAISHRMSEEDAADTAVRLNEGKLSLHYRPRMFYIPESKSIKFQIREGKQISNWVENHYNLTDEGKALFVAPLDIVQLSWERRIWLGDFVFNDRQEVRMMLEDAEELSLSKGVMLKAPKRIFCSRPGFTFKGRVKSLQCWEESPADLTVVEHQPWVADLLAQYGTQASVSTHIHSSSISRPESTNVSPKKGNTPLHKLTLRIPEDLRVVSLPDAIDTVDLFAGTLQDFDGFQDIALKDVKKIHLSGIASYELTQDPSSKYVRIRCAGIDAYDARSVQVRLKDGVLSLDYQHPADHCPQYKYKAFSYKDDQTRFDLYDNRYHVEPSTQALRIDPEIRVPLSWEERIWMGDFVFNNRQEVELTLVDSHRISISRGQVTYPTQQTDMRVAALNCYEYDPKTRTQKAAWEVFRSCKRACNNFEIGEIAPPGVMEIYPPSGLNEQQIKEFLEEMNMPPLIRIQVPEGVEIITSAKNRTL